MHYNTLLSLYKMLVKRFLLLITGLTVLNNLFAQLCQGSLGDPVVNFTFGSGANYGPPLGASITNYTYTANFCPSDGSYTIANSSSDCFSSTWHTVSEDHTIGDVNGYMMVVNASVTAGDFYVDTVRNLCGGTTYEFAAWLLNILKSSACGGSGIKPNITFRIESTAGTVLQTYNTGDIPATGSPVWAQYGLFFTTQPATSSVVLRMTNNAPGGCGNDLLLDDITFRPCGPKVSVSINGSLNSKIVCVGDTSGLTFTSTLVGGYTNPFYQWQKSIDSTNWTDIPGANNSSYSIPAILSTGNYFFRLEVAQGNNIFIPSCRVASDPVTVSVSSLPVPKASNNGPVCEAQNITLTANNGSNYSWTGPNNYTSNVQSPVITNTTLINNGKYFVKVTAANGCNNTDSTIIVIYQNPLVDAGNNDNVCEGASTMLHGSSASAVSWLWSPGQGLSDPASLTPIAAPGKTTWYTLTVNNGTCKNADSVLISVLTKPGANAGPDKAIVSNQFVILNGQATGSNISYYWTPAYFLSPDTTLKPKVNPPFDTAYILHVISRDGCGTATDTVLVKYYKDIYIPNAFTPNSDMLNDTWNIPALAAFPLAEVKVYNRFGQLIFYSIGNTKQWDGSFKGLPQPSGVYCYTIDLKNGMKILSGIVILIR